MRVRVRVRDAWRQIRVAKGIRVLLATHGEGLVPEGWMGYICVVLEARLVVRV